MADMPDPKGVRSLRDGEAYLKALTKHHIDQIVFPSGLNATGNENVHEAIKQTIDDTAFSHHNILGAVEQRCTWTATRSDGQQIFELEVNFICYLYSNCLVDADRPPADSPHPSHYGYDVSLNGNRMAGPGHVDFGSNVVVLNYRLGTEANDLLRELEVGKKEGKIGSGYLKYEAVIRSYMHSAL